MGRINGSDVGRILDDFEKKNKKTAETPVKQLTGADVGRILQEKDWRDDVNANGVNPQSRQLYQTITNPSTRLQNDLRQNINARQQASALLNMQSATNKASMALTGNPTQGTIHGLGKHYGLKPLTREERIVKEYESIPEYDVLSRAMQGGEAYRMASNKRGKLANLIDPSGNVFRVSPEDMREAKEKLDTDYNALYARKQALQKDYDAIKEKEAWEDLQAMGYTAQDIYDYGHSYVTEEEKEELRNQGKEEWEIAEYEKERSKKANDVINRLNEDLQKQGKSPKYYYAILDDYKLAGDERFAKDNPVDASVGSLLINPLESTANVAIKAGQYAKGKPLTYNQSITNTLREGASQNFDGIGRTAYMGGMSIGDMAVSALAATATGGGSVVSAGMQAIEKASQTLDEATQRDLTPNQIIAEGIASGITTYITEKIPMGKIDDIVEHGLSSYTSKEIGRVIAAQMISEGLQEPSEDIADWIADALIAGNKNQFTTDVKSYIAEGMTKQEAVAKVIGDRFEELGTDAVFGALGGLAMGGASIGVGYAFNQTKDTPSVQTEVVMKSAESLNMLLDAGKNLDPSMAAAEDADKIEYAKELANKPVEKLTEEDVIDIAIAVQEQATPENNLAQTINEINYTANVEENLRQYEETGKIEPKVDELPYEAAARQKAETYIQDYQAKSQEAVIKASDYFENEAAAKNFVENYNGQNLPGYTEASYLAYRAGESGQNFNTFLNNSKIADFMVKEGGVSEDYLKTIYYNGLNARTNENNEVTLKKNENRGFATGLVEGDKLADFKKKLAEKFNIEVFTDHFDAQMRGNFSAALAKLTVNATADNEYTAIVHEMFEFARAYDPKGMENAEKALVNMIVNKTGEQKFVDSVMKYREAYRRAGQNAPEGSSLRNEANKSFSEAQEEFINDAVSYIFSTDEGMKTFVDYIMNDNETSAEEKVSTIQAIKDWVDNLIKAIKNFISGRKNNLGYDEAEKAGFNVEELESLSRMLVGVLDTARENLAKMSEGQNAKAESKEAHSIDVTVDSEGNKLTEAQQEFFKDSKARDENGNLLVLYHGSKTPEKFTVFENRPAVNGRQLGDGFYFTTDKKMAENWGRGGHDGKPNVYKVYLNIKNPFIISDNIKVTQDMIDFAKNEESQVFERALANAESEEEREMLRKNESTLKKNAERMAKEAENYTTAQFYGWYGKKYVSEAGYDGLILKAEENSDLYKAYGDQYVVFDANQIKKTTNKKPTENDDIRFSLDVPVEEKAKEHFGTTEDFQIAGYLLTDGTMLDFSGSHWMEGASAKEIADWRRNNHFRQVDHEDIYEVMESSGDNRKQFMDRGNIRLSPEAPGFNISSRKEPTAAQYRMLKEFIREVKNNPEYDADRFYVDIETNKPNKIIYENNLNEDRIINDIKSYFETGEMPKQSTLDQFRYSLDVKYNDAYANNDTETMDKLVKQAAEKAGYDSPMLYHGTMDFGFTQIDLDKMDDKMSFFATDNLSIASSYAGTNKARGINESNAVSSENIVEALEELGRWKDIREFREGDEESRKEYLEEQFKRMYDFVHKNEKEMWNRKLMNDYNEFSNTLATQIMFNNIDDKQLNKLLKPLKEAHFVISDYAYAIHNALLLLRREGLSQNTYMLDGVPKTERSVRELYLPEEYQGIYKLYANTDNLLEIDGRGDNWNNIRVETEKKSYTPEELVEMMKERKNMFSDVSYDEESGLFSYNGVQRDKEFVERVLGVTDMHQSKYENLSTREIAQRANEQGYDGVIIKNITDDGGKSNSFKHYNEHGNIYIFFNPQEQVKSADTVTYDNEGNVIPLSKRFNKENDDIRYSIDVPAENVQNHDYSYETLKKKDPIPVNDVMDMGLKTIYVSKEVSSADLAAIVRENIEKYNDGNGLGNNKLYNNDLGSFVLIGHDGIKHNKNIISEGPVDALTSLPAFFKDAIVFNEMDGKKKGADLAYVLFGAYNNEEGTQIARVVVNHFEGENVIAEIENKLYAATKRTDVSRAESAPLIGEYSPSVSKLTITQLLNAVKRTFPNDLSEDVANHLHYKRERSDLGDTRYSIDVDAFMDAFEEIDNQVNLNENELHDLIKNRMDIESDVSKKMIKDVVSNIKKQYNSGIDKAELERGITTVFRYLNNTARYSMEDVMTVMTDIAKPVLENVKTASPEQEKLYKDFTDFVKGYKISLDADQMQEVRNEFGSYTEFKRMMSGKMKLDKNGTRLDDVWTEIADRSNGKLSYGTNPNDQPVELARYILGLNPTYQTLQGQSLDSAATDLALEIFRQFYVQQSMTDAAVKVKDEMAKRSQTMKERYQGVYNAAVKQVEYERSLNMKRLAEEIDNLTAEEQEAIRTGDTINQALIENIKSEYQKRYDRLKAESVEKIARAKANYQNAYINKNLRRERSELKNRLLREVKALQNIIAHPQEGATKHVPINLIKPTIEMLEAINLDNGGSNKAIVDRLKKMSEVYESFKNNEAYSFDYDERIANDIKELQEMFENRSYADLGIRELERVIEIVTALKTQIKNANNLILNGKYEDAKKAAESAMKDVEGSRRYDNAAMNALNRYGNIHLNAYREFRKLSGYKDGALMKIYRDLDEGSKREMQIQKDLGEIFQDVLEGQQNQKEVKKFISTKKEDLVDIGITDKSGKPIKITRAMRMSLIMHSMNAGNMRHILGSGITVPNMEYFAKGKLDEAYAKGTNYRFVDYAELLEAIQKNDTNKVNELTTKAEQRIEDMKKDLSDWERDFLRDAEQMFHEETGKIINDTSMALKGYALARVKNYFPIRTDSHFTNQEWSGLVRDGSLEGMGMLKERVISTKPILLEDITNVIQRQIKNVSKYGGFAVPTRNFETIMKQTIRNQSTGVLHNLSETIDNTWGASDTKWLKNLMQDIQGGRTEAESWIATFFNKLRGNFAAATLNMNIGVAIKQAASYPTAAAVTGWKPLLRNIPNLVNGFKGKGIAELEAINPLLWYRAQGYGTQDLADAKSSDLMKKLSPGVQKAIGWTQLFDTGTVRTLEYVAKDYVDHNFKDLEKGSEEYWQKVSDVFSSIVEETQPNYSKLHQADVIRNPNAMSKMTVMFKTQPMQNFGIVYDAMGELNAAVQSGDKTWQKEATSKVARAVSSQVVSATVFSLMTFVGNVLKHRTDRYKDEDDEWSIEKILQEFATSFVSCLVGGFIGGAVIYEGVKFFLEKVIQKKGARYYGLDVSAVEVINDLVTNAGKVGSAIGSAVTEKTAAGKETSAKKSVDALMTLAETIGEYIGVPVRNMKQLMLSMVYYTMDAVEGVENGDFHVSGDKDLLDNWEIASQYERIYEATLNGDAEEAERLTQQLVKQMMSDKKEELKTGDITEDAIIEAVQNDVVNKMNNIVKADFLEGTATEEEALDYLTELGWDEDAAYLQLQKWEGGSSSEYKPMNDAIAAAAKDPTPENRKKVIEEIKGLVEHGKTKKGVKDSISKKYKAEYIELYNKDKAADLHAILLTAFMTAGFTEEEAKAELKKWVE